jgi:hypothetical protein
MEGDCLEDLGVDGRILLKWIFKKWDEGMDRIDLAQDRDTERSCCECDNEASGFIK